MKIAILNQPQDPMAAGDEQRGSVAIVNWELAKRLAKRHRIVIYAPRTGAQPLVETYEGVEIRRISFTAKIVHKGIQLVSGRLGGRVPYAFSPPYYREYYWQVARDISSHPVDVIHVPVQLQFAALFKAHAPRARLVSHMHQDEMAQLDDRFLRSHLRDIDSVVTVSDFISDRSRSRFPEFASRIHTIGNGVDVTRFRPNGALVRDERPRRLLFVGRIAPDKGVHLLARAFSALVQELPGLEMDIVGKPGMMPLDVLGVLLRDDGALEAVRDFYGRSTLGWLKKEVLGQRRSYLDHVRALIPASAAGQVRFHGTVPLAELVKLYQAADLLVLPSVWQESYGLPVAEAMASGTPVLATRSGGVPELVEDGVTGRLVPRLDPDALTQALREMLSDPGRLRAMGVAGRARAERLLTWDRSAARLAQILEAAQPPAGPAG